MKAYLFTIGEKTTDICAGLLAKYGFTVVRFISDEPIAEKYGRFIRANAGMEDCLKIDADIIPNKNIKLIIRHSKLFKKDLPRTINYSCYDFYHNMPWVGCPTYYSKEAMKVIRENLDKLDPNRPETSACRLPEIHLNNVKSDLVVGAHGFFQHKQDTIRCIEQKKLRGQQDQFDFDLLKELTGL